MKTFYDVVFVVSKIVTDKTAPLGLFPYLVFL